MLRFGVWAALTELASTWSCRSCGGETRKARGNCGGPFTADLLDTYPMASFTDEDGTLVRDGAWRERDGRIVISADVACSRLDAGTFSSCPVAATRSPWVSHVNACHRASEAGELRIIEPCPSAALVDAIGAVTAAVGAVGEFKSKNGGG